LSASQAIQSPDLPKSVDPLVLDSLTCPTCRHPHSSLIARSETLQCAECSAEFPLFTCGEAAIPWLHNRAEFNLLEWKARFNGFLHINQLEQKRLKDALKDKRLSKSGQKRISRILNAKKQQILQVSKLVKPLGLEIHMDNLIDNKDIFESKVPKNQGMDSYYNNIFRDWAWENGENEALLNVIDSVIVDEIELGKVLTVGAGAGRLSYDIHHKYSPTCSALLDINPLLLLSACQVIQGIPFELNEFPIAPLNKDSFVVEQKCSAPRAVDENIFYLFADGMNPPVKEKSFDTVVTPWLLDIIPQNLRDYIPRLNACLPIGGTWINTGSLAFFHQQASWCYSEEEVLELIEKNGFKVISSNRKTIQYMKSPLSAHGRTESVFSFHAKKIKDVVVPPTYEYLPDWIRDTTKSIPKDYEQEINSSKHLLQAQVFGAIDGARSVEQISELIAKQYDLELKEATHAVRSILIDFEEKN